MFLRENSSGLLSVIVLIGTVAACHSRKPVMSAYPIIYREPVDLVGRFDREDPRGPRFAWSGSAIRARFTGTRVAVRLGDTASDGSGGVGNHYAVRIDNRSPMQLIAQRGEHTYALAADLKPGEHTLVLHKRTEAFVGEGQFFGLLLDDNAEILKPKHRSRRLEVIGDSISAGYGIEGTDETCSFSPSSENHALAYGALTAEQLNADLVTVAWSGIGMERNLNGDRTETMPVLYQRTLPERPDNRWDHSTSIPDVVVINLGTNDLFAKGSLDHNAFKETYGQFVRELRRYYPLAQIICATGPMFTDEGTSKTKSVAHDLVSSVVTTAQRAGDQRIHYSEFAPQDIKQDGTGCDAHPNVITHRKMADQLTAAIRELTGWTDR